MNLTFLRYAVEVEKTGSISLAARNLYLGQPNVSKAIKELELSLGIAIFKRTPRGVIPTPKGEEFLHYARSILSQIDELEGMFREEKAERAAFHVVVPHAEYITSAFARMTVCTDECREVDMSLQESSAMDAIELVAQQEYNLGVIRYNTEYEQQFQTLLGDKDLISKPIWEMDSLLLMSATHPLAKLPQIDLHDLENCKSCVELVYGDVVVPFISAAEARRSAAMEAEKRHISIYSHGGLYELLENVPGAFIWSSPVPQQMLERNGCVQRRCKGNVPRFKDVLIHHKDYRLKEIDKQFIACLNQTKEELAWKEYR